MRVRLVKGKSALLAATEAQAQQRGRGIFASFDPLPARAHLCPNHLPAWKETPTRINMLVMKPAHHLLQMKAPGHVVLGAVTNVYPKQETTSVGME